MNKISIIVILWIFTALLNAGLVAYYPFNGNANDESGNGFHGTVNGATLAADRFGEDNKAYYFDGTSAHIEVANNSVLNPLYTYTVSAWVNVSTGKTYAGIANNIWDSGSNESGYGLCFADAAPRIGNIASTTGTSSWWSSGCYTEFELYKWTHIVGTFDGSYAKIYRDGQLVNSIPVSGNIKYNFPNSMWIGRYHDDNEDYYYHGYIDDVRVYNNALSGSDVWSLYKSEWMIKPSGSGILGDPYLINNLQNLLWVSENPSEWSAHYLQTADIDASATSVWNEGAGWSPIGYDWDHAFFGNYDGGGHTISGLTLYRNGSNQAFIGVARDASVQDLIITGALIQERGNNSRVAVLIGESQGSTVTNCHTEGTVNGSGTHVGGLIGFNGSTVSGCSFNGNVSDDLSGSNYFGGLVGYNTGLVEDSYSVSSVIGNWYAGGLVGYNYGGTVERCYSASSDGNYIFGSYYTGGLTGYNNNSGSITESYSTADVKGYVNITGGLTGSNNNSTISDCYSLGTVTRLQGSDGDFGSFIGKNENSSVITNCYTTGPVIYDGTVDPTDKGFIGNYNSTGCTGNFFDSQTTVQSGGAGAAPKTTAEMKTQSTFTDAGWDFTDIWNIDGVNNDGYAYLQWMFPPPAAPSGVTVVYTSSNPELSWNAVAGAVSYKIYSSADPYADFSTWDYETEVLSGTTWTDESATETKKFYVVVAVN